MPAVPDEPIHHGRADGRAQRRPGGDKVSAPNQLRAYRVVKRYRGDQRPRDFGLERWAELWQLQAGDSSWPPEREG